MPKAMKIYSATAVHKPNKLKDEFKYYRPISISSINI